MQIYYKKEYRIKMNIELLKNLCSLNGISGDEANVRKYIISQIRNNATTIKTDNMGNLIAFKKGKKTPNKKLMISAHMDEVGFIVTDITRDGFLKFTEVGGIDRRVVMGKTVSVGKDNINGVICAKPVHLLDSDERDKIASYSSMCIDIGAKDKAEAMSAVNLGDSVSFSSPFICEKNVIIGKAIDDRAGCMMMIEMINSDLEYDMWFSFVVQEEVGLRGSKCAVYDVEPDLAIVIEATTAADIPNVEPCKQVCNVGDGAVISFMDRRTIYDKQLVKLAMKCGKENGVKAQLKKAVAGGNDAGAIHSSKSGVRTVAVSVPCRYLHSCCGLIADSDLYAVAVTVKAIANAILSDCI